MGSISVSKIVIVVFLIVLIFGDFSSLINKVKLNFKTGNKKNRKKGS